MQHSTTASELAGPDTEGTPGSAMAFLHWRIETFAYRCSGPLHKETNAPTTAFYFSVYALFDRQYSSIFDLQKQGLALGTLRLLHESSGARDDSGRAV
ncbi:hypothetical protein IF1G_01068 [Cordyceps javanica]|uniref:Uncharacterized protein n=1 Tax=Cordyceps javanica TaxID=43265 RepID=A0A545VHD1_9HYPO|nr:hypothetical protein IF1G_01068 [Cordyceps javanica]